MGHRGPRTPIGARKFPGKLPKETGRELFREPSTKEPADLPLSSRRRPRGRRLSSASPVLGDDRDTRQLLGWIVILLFVFGRHFRLASTGGTGRGKSGADEGRRGLVSRRRSGGCTRYQSGLGRRRHRAACWRTNPAPARLGTHPIDPRGQQDPGGQPCFDPPTREGHALPGDVPCAILLYYIIN